jgi:hypothetical protein
VFPRRAGDADAQDRLGLRQVKDLRAVGKRRRSGLPGVEPPGIDLTDQEDEVGFDPTGLADDLGKAAEHVSVRKRLLRK